MTPPTTAQGPPTYPTPEVAHAVEPLPEPYHHLFRRVIKAVEDEQRIRGLWLSGSLARGDADAGSDLDLVLAVADDHFDDFVERWPQWTDQFGPHLLIKAIPGSKLVTYALTTDFCCYDLVVEPVGALPTTPHRSRVAVLDPDGLTARLPAVAVGPGPDLDRITALIEEYWRIFSMTPVMIKDRQDLFCAEAGVRAGIQLLYDVFVACNQPLPPMGVKQYAAKLRPEQLEALRRIPGAGIDHDQLVAAHLAITDVMASVGRESAERVGARYPVALAAAVTDYVKRRFGVG